MFKVKRGRRLIALSAGVMAAGTGLAVAVATVGSAAPMPPFGSPYTVTLNQQIHGETPITATGFSNGECVGIPSTDDGWHFVLPGDFTEFISITLSFTGGTILTGPTFSHGGTQAVVGTTPGAVLQGGTALVQTEVGQKQVSFFTLSNTCPASSSTSPPPPSGSPHPSRSPHPSGSPSSPPPGAPTPTPVPGNLPVTG